MRGGNTASAKEALFSAATLPASLDEPSRVSSTSLYFSPTGRISGRAQVDTWACESDFTVRSALSRRLVQFGGGFSFQSSCEGNGVGKLQTNKRGADAAAFTRS